MEPDWLVRLFGVPRRNGPADEVWARIEQQLGHALPKDYKDLASGYGDAVLGGYLYVPHPQGGRPLVSWMEEQIAGLRLVFGDDLPGSVDGGLASLVPWGCHNYDGDGLYLCLRNRGGAADWSVAVDFRQWGQVIDMDVPLRRFVADFVNGERAPRGWPRAADPWADVDG